MLVDGVQQEVTVGGVTQDYFVAPDAGSVVNTIVGLGIPRDRQSALAVEACTRDVCRTSNTTILSKTEVRGQGSSRSSYISVLFPSPSLVKLVSLDSLVPH